MALSSVMSSILVPSSSIFTTQRFHSREFGVMRSCRPTPCLLSLGLFSLLLLPRLRLSERAEPDKGGNRLGREPKHARQHLVPVCADGGNVAADARLGAGHLPGC